MTADTDGSGAGAGELAPAALRGRLAAGDPVTLLDVRNREEVERWRIEAPSLTRVHVPYMKFLAAGVSGDVTDLLPAGIREPVVVVCPHGEASAEVADQLVAAGIDAENLAGGMEGWARLYDRTAVAEGDATVYQYRRPASGCLGYAVVAGGEMAVVDPLRAFVDRYRSDAAALGADLAYAVDTHLHADHVSGVRALASATGATPVLPRGAVERGVDDAAAFETVADGDALDVGGVVVEAVALPGHTTGMTGFRVEDAGVLLTGDSLFLTGVARPDLQEGADPEAQARDLHATLTDRLARVPDDTLVAPGHVDAGVDEGPAVARLGDLRDRLAVFGMDETAFVDHATRAGADPANAARIVAINRGREAVDDDEAFELELGPNNCAAG
ncbi:MBL fold metallo-hydrolase [Haloplanus halophilus]|uniref:MBL fold metallo-hydrolase n=1 Tax=Haloplanus halophilus TaxID=2949993 RepID=UPI002040E69D|nr:MBL fold metallo-hydrolase [Haloplanus sp. GDY1]